MWSLMASTSIAMINNMIDTIPDSNIDLPVGPEPENPGGHDIPVGPGPLTHWWERK
jgi:hypothetical protein